MLANGIDIVMTLVITVGSDYIFIPSIVHFIEQGNHYRVIAGYISLG